MYKPVFVGAVFLLQSGSLLIVTELTGLPVVGFTSGRLVAHKIRFVLSRGGKTTEDFPGYWQYYHDQEIVSQITSKGKTEYFTFFHTKQLLVKERIQ